MSPGSISRLAPARVEAWIPGTSPGMTPRWIFGVSPMTATATSASQEDEDAILDSVGKWLERDVRAYVRALEHDDIYPAEMVEQMRALGLFGATIGTAY